MNPTQEVNSSSQRKVVSLNLRLLPWQEETSKMEALYLYLMAGRRQGKSKFLIYKGLQWLGKPNSVVWYLAPKAVQAKDIAWRPLMDMISPIASKTRIVESQLFIELPNKSVFALKGADDSDIRRGPGLQGILMDEAQDFNSDVLDTVLRPLLSGTGGPWPLIAAGTKKYSNWFRDRWILANQGKLSKSKAVYIPVGSNPEVSMAELNSIKDGLFKNGKEHIWHQE